MTWDFAVAVALTASPLALGFFLGLAKHNKKRETILLALLPLALLLLAVLQGQT